MFEAGGADRAARVTALGEDIVDRAMFWSAERPIPVSRTGGRRCIPTVRLAPPPGAPRTSRRRHARATLDVSVGVVALPPGWPRSRGRGKTVVLSGDHPDRKSVV